MKPFYSFKDQKYPFSESQSDISIHLSDCIYCLLFPTNCVASPVCELAYPFAMLLKAVAVCSRK